MIISVASGKGGTGKTTVAVNIALSLKGSVIVDCDVEEPNAAIFLKPEISSVEDVSALLPEVDESLCDRCGLCAGICEYKAINVFKNISSGVFILPHLCHNCGACVWICPHKAIKEVPKRIGIVETGFSGDIFYVAGRLDPGEIKTPFLINEVKKKISRERPTIIDSPPGASCPMVAAVKGSDFCLMVTEPTEFGMNDLEIAVEAVRKMNIPLGVVINKWEGQKDFEARLTGKGIKVIEKIPFDREIAVSYSKGATAISLPGYADIFGRILEKIFLFANAGRSD
ncbi:MAG: 4Fe-4S binding protein [Elusimicrobia bacterium]|nr:4Fe-4S binding protein [Elusimicrobiota bacterium]